MAEKKLYKFNVRKNIRVFNLSNGRQVFVKDGYFETDDRQLGLMIAEEYKGVVTMAVGSATPGAAPIDPISGSPSSESDKFKPLLSVVDDDDDWGDDNEEGAGAAGGATTQPGTTEPLPEGAQAAVDALSAVAGAAAAGAAAVAAEKKPETAAEKKAREKAEKEAAKSVEAK